MTKIVKIALSIIVLISMSAVSANATVAKGQKLYLKKLKSACGINGSVMAAKHTMAEWEAINAKGKLAKEIKRVCPKVKDKAIKEKLIPHYYDFFYEFASDSGNIPSC